ncbi:MAG: hypothetical protein ABIO63_01315 [Casimicrobiaceae bacterium]
MSVLRVVLEAVPLPARAAAWALFDAHGHRLRSGHGVPATWPDAVRREGVLAASRVRLMSLQLPPMPADRVGAAAAFALEDVFARPAGEQHLHVSARDAKGRVLATATERVLVDALSRDFTRLVAEPALAPVPQAGRWLWLPSAADDTFVRQPDAAAFPVSHPRDALTLPAELMLPLTQPGAGLARPAAVDVAFAVTDAQLVAWSAATQVAFVRREPWRWDGDGHAFAQVPELALQAGAGDTPPPSGARRTWRRAGAIAAMAIIGGTLTTIIQWSWLRIDHWRTQGAIVAVATDAGVTGVTEPDAAATALARRWAEVRHRAARPVPGDAMPLLARAAPAMGALPAGALKSATFSPGQWTFELGVVPPAAVRTFEQQLASRGLLALSATNASGTRLRATLAPGLDRP